MFNDWKIGFIELRCKVRFTYSHPNSSSETLAQARGKPDSWVVDLIIIGQPISPLAISLHTLTNSGSNHRMNPIWRITQAFFATAMI
jgi:hypothetical protein